MHHTSHITLHTIHVTYPATRVTHHASLTKHHSDNWSRENRHLLLCPPVSCHVLYRRPSGFPFSRHFCFLNLHSRLDCIIYRNNDGDTAGAQEARAWSFKLPSKAPAAAGLIHSDIQQASAFFGAKFVWDSIVRLC